jgi:polyisoprenoid-binding protein YceI
MNRTVRNVLIGVVVIVVLVGVAYTIFSLRAGTGEASATISAPTLAVDDSTASSGDAVVYAIAADQSQVSFELDEDLRGQRVTVIGTTNQVAGEILVNFDSPTETEVGVIRVNARTLATDNNFRNQAIRGEILQSARDDFEFITFTPTRLEGLPESVTLGEPITFQIIGDLQIRDVVQEVTFEATVTPTREQLTGTATAAVQRGDFGLTIPSVPSVANVEEEVTLTLTFVALPTDGTAPAADATSPASTPEATP